MRPSSAWTWAGATWWLLAVQRLCTPRGWERSWALGRIIIPTEAGVGSAVGFLLAPVAFEVVRSRHQLLSELQADLVNGLWDDMQQEALAVVRQGAGTGLQETRHAYMRYVGQGHEIPVSLPVEACTSAHRDIFRDAFESAYRQLYGRIIEGVEIEVLSWTLTVSAPIADSGSETLQAKCQGVIARPHWRTIGVRPFMQKPVDARVYLRGPVAGRRLLAGPALITEEPDHDGCHFELRGTASSGRVISS